MREKINESKKEPLKIQGFTITTLLAYFIIYSIIGFIIETIFGILTKGVLESRKSFIIGPFCSIYGLGAVIIIMIFLMIDMVITGIGLKVFFVRLVSENKVQLNIEEKYIDKYIEQYKNMPMKSLVDKIFSNKEMLKTFPNLKITNKDGNVVLIRDILSDINPYYLKVFTPKVIDKVKFAE